MSILGNTSTSLESQLRHILDTWDEYKDIYPSKAREVYKEGIDDWNILLDEYPEEIDSMEDIQKFVKICNKTIQESKKNKKSDNYEPKVISLNSKKNKKSETEVEITPSADAVEQVSASEAKNADIRLINYGKGLLVYGSGTVALKKELKEIGGIWVDGKKKHLRKAKDLPTGVKSGWVFLAEDKSKLEKLLSAEVECGTDVVFTADNKHYAFRRSERVKLGIKKLKERRKAARKNKKVLALPPSRRMLELPPWEPEEEVKTKKSSKKTTSKKTTSKRGKREKVGESPNWYKTMCTFVEAAGRTIPTRSVRRMLSDLQDRFDSRRGLTTPHVAIIRDIQDCLLPYANKKAEKVKLPAWKSVVSQAKAAMRTINVTGKVSYENISKMTLSGFGYWRLDYPKFEDEEFSTLAEAKQFVKSLNLTQVRAMTRNSVFIYYTDSNDDITKVCNFNVRNGKVVFKPVEEY